MNKTTIQTFGKILWVWNYLLVAHHMEMLALLLTSKRKKESDEISLAWRYILVSKLNGSQTEGQIYDHEKDAQWDWAFWWGKNACWNQKGFFWHDRTDFVKKFVKVCDRCQLAKQTSNMKSGVEGMKIILVCDLFYWVTLDTAGILLETSSGNKYVLVAIDHYSKWCETRLMKEHDVITIAIFLEEEIICWFGVPKHILTDNDIEWMMLCVKIMVPYTALSHQHGHNAMAWWNI